MATLGRNAPTQRADLGRSLYSHGPQDSHTCREHQDAAFSELLNVFFSPLGLSSKPTHCFPVRLRHIQPSTQLNHLPEAIPITCSLIHPIPLFTNIGPDLAASWTPVDRPLGLSGAPLTLMRSCCAELVAALHQ